MYVSEGFTQALEVAAGTVGHIDIGRIQTWLCAFNTELFRSRPMRAVPISWMPAPGA